jgi:signal transduction histidine kinase
MRRSALGKVLRFGLQHKLILFGLLLAVAPLLAIWPVGEIEELLRREIVWEVDRCAEEILAELRRGDGDGGDAEARLQRIAERRHVMVRLLDEEGRVTLGTSPRHAERWASVRGLWQGLDDIFYGPTGPPDLLAFEARLPEEARRPEVVEALAGRSASTWRYDDQARMFVYSLAKPTPHGGALQVTRISRRVIRSLYDMRYQLLKLTLFTAAAAVLFGLYIGRRMVAPLVAMERAVESYLKHPKKDALREIALRRDDEIGDLSRSFEALTMRLHMQVEERASVAGDLAHDLKNPIATVAAAAELLESSPGITPERQERLARALTSAATHMRRSVDGLLGLARLDEQLTSMDHTPVDLHGLVHRVVEEVQATPRCEAIELTLELYTDEGEQAVLMGAEEQLEMLLGSLLDNALTFCSEAVHVAVSRRDGSHRIAISDDGPGVSEGNREKIFRRFFSVRPSEAPQGTGLGLSIAASIAKAHGGSVELAEQAGTEESRLPGACFVVVLPEL